MLIHCSHHLLTRSKIISETNVTFSFISRLNQNPISLKIYKVRFIIFRPVRNWRQMRSQGYEGQQHQSNNIELLSISMLKNIFEAKVHIIFILWGQKLDLLKTGSKIFPWVYIFVLLRKNTSGMGKMVLITFCCAVKMYMHPPSGDKYLILFQFSKMKLIRSHLAEHCYTETFCSWRSEEEMRLRREEERDQIWGEGRQEKWKIGKGEDGKKGRKEERIERRCRKEERTKDVMWKGEDEEGMKKIEWEEKKKRETKPRKGTYDK